MMAWDSQQNLGFALSCLLPQGSFEPTGQSWDSWQRWTGDHYKERGESCSSELDKGALNYLKGADDIY